MIRSLEISPRHLFLKLKNSWFCLSSCGGIYVDLYSVTIYYAFKKLIFERLVKRKCNTCQCEVTSLGVKPGLNLTAAVFTDSGDFSRLSEVLLFRLMSSPSDSLLLKVREWKE